MYLKAEFTEFSIFIFSFFLINQPTDNNFLFRLKEKLIMKKITQHQIFTTFIL